MTLLYSNSMRLSVTIKMPIAITAMVLMSASVSKTQNSSSSNALLLQLHGTQAASLLAKVDRKQLPADARMEPEFQQAFLLRAPGSESLGVVASYFNHEENVSAKNPPEQCGMFFIKPNGENLYISTIGPNFEYGSNLCGAVRAVGTVADPGPRPRIIGIFNGTNMHGDEYPVPFLFTWNVRSNSYQLDTATSEWLRRQERSNTIAQVRRLLQNRK